MLPKTDISRCGNDPKGYEMGFEDGVVMCGEWELGKNELCQNS